MDHLPRQRHALVLLVMRKLEEKKKKTDSRGEDKKERNISYV